jgi:hypothetical protein
MALCGEHAPIFCISGHGCHRSSRPRSARYRSLESVSRRAARATVSVEATAAQPKSKSRPSRKPLPAHLPREARSPLSVEAYRPQIPFFAFWE